MSDWSRPFDVAYRVMRVDRVTGVEVAELPWVISGGSIDRDLGLDIRESGSLTVLGDPRIGADWVRVWADVTWHDGSRESVALGTFLPNVPKRDIDWRASTSPIDLYGLLQNAASDVFENPVTIGEGENPVDQAADILKGCGLKIAAYDSGDYTLSEPWTFGLRGADGESSDGSKLDAVNELLDLANYSAARTNPMGEIVLEPYEIPQDRAPSWDFTEGERARFLAQMTEERDLMNVANVVKVTYWTSEKEYTAVAIDDDPNSEFSTVTRGRRVAATYEYSNIPEDIKDDDKAIQDLAYKTADSLLNSVQSVVHRITFSHVYAPVNLHDVVSMTFPTGGVEGNFAIWSQHIDLAAGIPIQCEARDFDRKKGNSFE